MLGWLQENTCVTADPTGGAAKIFSSICGMKKMLYKYPKKYLLSNRPRKEMGPHGSLVCYRF